MVKAVQAKELKNTESLEKARSRRKKFRKTFEALSSSDKDLLLKELAVRAGLIEDSEDE